MNLQAAAPQTSSSSTPTDVQNLNAIDLLHHYRNRSLSPVEVTQAVLRQIRLTNRSVNAFVLVDEARALTAARASEARWQRGEPLGLVDGIPTTVKDLLLTKNWPTLRGSRAISLQQSWQEDAPAVAQLRSQGAIFLGKTTTSEFGWKGVTESPLSGITRNPWNLELTPGGSSGGAAVAAALNLGMLHISTDGGGSTRQPAAFTGVFGFKPTFGRVAGYPSAHTGTLFHIGVITRHVEDAALGLTAIAHPDPRDWYALPESGQDYRLNLGRGVKGLRIAYSPNLGYAAVEPEVAALVEKAVQVFATLGAIVEPVDPGFENPYPIFRTFWITGAAKLLRSFTAEQRALVEDGLQASAAAGEAVTLAEYQQALEAREALGRQLSLFHQNYDLLLTPTLPIVAFPVGQGGPQSALYPPGLHWTPFTYPFNLTQQPAASVPIGFTAAGLPVGLQIVGAKYNDALVLQAAKAYETVHPFTTPTLR
ncbi:amidase [Alkalinema sp. FACHB-956]|uniref:amidase n=1 Tax=Alkalinema sp. FACHB-956 TaxID=2692768 RepID=UPI0016899CCD|nr:amidase [Alkalinema sp. FACHB-956]MBD2329239.1 amidase [Alkalinema sp. FACHB-956]